MTRRIAICLGSILLLIAMFGPTKAQSPVFPLHVSADRRHLEDATGQPFLIAGDAAWSLIGDLSREDIEAYLDDRKERGFNTVLVSLIEHRFSRKAPRDYYGDAPFETGEEFLSPNEAYFQYADWVLQLARQKGFLVLLAPAYLGINGGDEGWYREMEKAGPEALHSYGEYLGRRFGKLGNIIWVEGGDDDPSNRSLVQSLAEGIKQVAPDNLQSFHGSPESAPRDLWDDPSWLNLDTVYTYHSVVAASLDHYNRYPSMPFFLIESRYEGEGANEFSLRQIAYSALLSGACGQVFGNNPVWHFNGPGLFPTRESWRQALASRGAKSISYLNELFAHLQWWTLKPDPAIEAAVPTAGKGGVLAASAAGGAFAIAYIWDTPIVAVRSSWAALSVVRAKWFDPSSGRYDEALGQATVSGDLLFKPPQQANAAGFSDWVLLVSK